LPVLLVSVVIFASGCTTPSTGAGSGITILDFTSDMPSYQSGDNVQLQLRFQNQGGVMARSVTAELAGISLSDWSGGIGTGIMYDQRPDLLPYDSETNTQGGTDTVQWRLMAPNQQKGLNIDYEAIAKVTYDYKTSAQKMITVVNEDELRRIKQTGVGSLPMRTVVYSAGPLAVEVTTGEYAKTAVQQFGYNNLFPVYIRISNVGGGNIVPPGTGSGFYGGAYSSSYFGQITNYPVGIEIIPPQGTSFMNLGGAFGSEDCSTGRIT
jgi:hypothetical protein